MNGKIIGFLSAKGTSIFAVLAWLAFFVGGVAFAIFTLLLAITFELIEQIKTKVASFRSY